MRIGQSHASGADTVPMVHPDALPIQPPPPGRRVIGGGVQLKWISKVVGA